VCDIRGMGKSQPESHGSSGDHQRL
jgi:hypothetical protein